MTIAPIPSVPPSGRESAPAPVEPVGCSNCGADVSEAYRFCPHCGELFEERPTLRGFINRRHYHLLGLFLVIIAILIVFVVLPLRDQTDSWAAYEKYQRSLEYQLESGSANEYLPPSQYLKGPIEGITLLAPRPLFRELVKAIILLKLNAPNHFALARQQIDNVHFLPYDNFVNSDHRQVEAVGDYRREAKTVVLYAAAMNDDAYTLAWLLMHEAGHGYFKGEYASLDDPRFIAEQIACDQLAFQATRGLVPANLVKAVEFSQSKLTSQLAGRCPLPALPAIDEPARSTPAALPDTWIDLIIERRLDPDLGGAPRPVRPDPALIDTGWAIR